MNSWMRACLVSVWSTNVRQSQTHARHVEMETCNDQTTMRKTHHYIAEPCLSSKTPASQHHNQNRACVDESVLAQKKHQQRQHCEDWICLACVDESVLAQKKHQQRQITRTGFVSPPFTKRSAVHSTSTFQRKAHTNTTTRIRRVPCHLQSTRRRNTSATTRHRAQAELIASNIHTHSRLLLSLLTALGVTAGRARTAAAVEKLARVKKAAGRNFAFQSFENHPGTLPTTFSRCPRRLTQRLLRTERLHPILHSRGRQVT